MNRALRMLAFCLCTQVVLIIALLAQNPVQPTMVSGNVVDDADHPLENVSVNYSLNGKIQRDSGIVTDSKGRFSFSIKVPGRFSMLYSKERFFPAQLNYTAVPGELIDETVRLKAFGVITGRVSDTTGQPISGQLVSPMLRRTTEDGYVVWTRLQGALSNDKGEFRLFDLIPGAYVLCFSEAGPTPPEFTALPAEPYPIQDPRAPNKIRRAPSLYPGVGRMADATTVIVEPGKETNLSPAVLGNNGLGTLQLILSNPESASKDLSLGFGPPTVTFRTTGGGGAQRGPSVLAGRYGRQPLHIDAGGQVSNVYQLTWPGTYDVLVNWKDTLGQDINLSYRFDFDGSETRLAIVLKEPSGSNASLIVHAELEELDGSRKPLSGTETSWGRPPAGIEIYPGGDVFTFIPARLQESARQPFTSTTSDDGSSSVANMGYRLRVTLHQ